MSNWKAFKKALARHPGIGIGFIWPLMVFGAILTRKDHAEFPLINALIVSATLGALPWVIILYTAWKMRLQYQGNSDD